MISELYRWLPEQAIELLSTPLPDRVGVYNGVAVQDVPFFQRHDYEPYKKEKLWQAVKEVASNGDMITFVGGGKGIVPIKAAQRGYDVMVIEGAKEYATLIEESAGLNSVDLDVVHGVVGEANDVWGDYSDAKTIAPEDIRGDVVVLDCEGAETSILPLWHIPKVVVETHPMHGVTETKVRKIMDGEPSAYGRNEHGGQLLIKA